MATGFNGSSPLARGLPGSGWQEVQAGGIIPARAGFTPVILWFLERSWDHPRSRGVYLLCVTDHLRGAGSSPLARGLPSGGVKIGGMMGIIPARAGFTQGWIDKVNDAGDHPRSRGVYTWRSA